MIKLRKERLKKNGVYGWVHVSAIENCDSLVKAERVHPNLDGGGGKVKLGIDVFNKKTVGNQLLERDSGGLDDKKEIDPHHHL